MKTCKGWILTISKMDLPFNITTYKTSEKFFIDYNEMKEYKNYLETNQTEQTNHKTIVSCSVLW